jgi:single-stranded DNA-specific DHH superfamily exonuclease
MWAQGVLGIEPEGVAAREKQQDVEGIYFLDAGASQQDEVGKHRGKQAGRQVTDHQSGNGEKFAFAYVRAPGSPTQSIAQRHSP